MKSRIRNLFFRGIEPVPGNKLRLLQNGTEFFPALIAAIDAAHTEIHLETYIVNADPTTGVVRDALMRAARRGVQVRVLIDGVGSRELPADWLDALKKAGVSVLIYRPIVSGWLSNPHNLRRLHRKLAVIDARIALVGGMNLMDDFEPVRFDAPRLDFDLTFHWKDWPKGSLRLGHITLLPDAFDARRLMLTPEWDRMTLKSAADVLAAQTAGELTIEQPGVVINMPFVVWDGGKR